MSEPELVHTQVEGRDATVAYFDDDFVFTTPDKGTLAKVIFHDTGEAVFVVPSKPASGADFDPDQPRDESGKWTSGSGATAAKATPSRDQISAALDKVYEKANAAKQEIDSHADSIAAQTGGTVAKAPLKGRDRALEKVEQKYKGDVSRLKDVARNTVVVPAGNEDKALALLKSKAPGSVPEVKSPATDPLGYSGINVDVPTKTGLWAEMQINSPEMIYAKEPTQVARAILGNTYDKIAGTAGLPPGGQGHKFYEQWRTMEPGSPAAQAVAAQSRDYYAAFRRAA